MALGIYIIGKEQETIQEARHKFQNNIRLLEKNTSSAIIDIQTFIATGDENFNQSYNTQKSQTIGQKPWLDGRLFSVIKTLSQAAQTEEETKYLSDITQTLSVLEKNETKAINAMLGLFDDGYGRYNRRAEPDTMMAMHVLHGATYQETLLEFKTSINNYYKLVDKRLNDNIVLLNDNITFTAFWADIFLFIILTMIILNYLLFHKRFLSQLKQLKTDINSIASGNYNIKIAINSQDEIADIQRTVQLTAQSLSSKADFVENVGKQNFESNFTPVSDSDLMGIALLEMREKLKLARKNENKRKLEEKQRSWISNGLAKFSEILRQNSDIEDLSEEIITHLVKYLDATLAALFTINKDNPDDIFIELVSAFAYDRKRIMQKRIELNEGILGRVYDEGVTVHMTEIPSDYIKIKSGLGGSTPNSLVVVPLVLNDNILGMIEIATLETFAPHQIQFVEELGQSLATTLASIEMNIKTKMLLEVSEKQSIELSEKEEILRQNIEEIQSNQENIISREAKSKKKTEELLLLQKTLNQKNNDQQREIAKLVDDNNQYLSGLKTQKNRLNNILQKNLDGVVAINAKGEISFFNEKAGSIWGYATHEVLGQNVKILMPDEFATNHDTYIQNYLKSGMPKIIGTGRKVEILKKDNTKTTVFLWIIDTSDSEHNSFTAFIRETGKIT